MLMDRHAAATANRRGMVETPGSLGGRKDPSNCRVIIVVVVVVVSLDVFTYSEDDGKTKDMKGKKIVLMTMVGIIIL
jgi:hypothetical protein